MPEPSLLDELRETFTILNRLAARYQATQEYAATQERLAFLHTLAQRLQDELEQFKQATSMGDLHSSNGVGSTLWRETCTTLNKHEPAALRSPARALVAADPDLLKVVEYLSWATAYVRERRTQLHAPYRKSEADR
ncbi:MAG: hypothetical protein HC914_19790 [Chloroflexaceae bacterium]|nr:hypothetical protein [Chloroflexaceae bacterium]